MIYAFKNTSPGVTACDFTDIISDYAPFTNIYVVDSSFYFSNETAIQDLTQWYNQIVLKNIIPIYDIKDLEDNNEESIKHISVQDVEIEIYKGKYKYTAYYNYDNELYKKINKLHNRPAYVYLTDKNNNIFGILTGTEIYGINCEMFSVSKLMLGSTKEPSGIKITMTFDSVQFDNLYNTKIDFDSTDLIYYPEPTDYEITNVSNEVPSIVIVTVKDQNDDPLEGLLIGNFTIEDDYFTISGYSPINYSVQETLPGVYEIERSHPITSGTVYVNYNDIIITYNYTLKTVTISMVLSLVGTYSNVVRNTFTNQIPSIIGFAFTDTEPLSISVADYNFQKDTGTNSCLLNIYNGTGTQTWMIRSIATSLLPDNTQYIIILGVGSDIPVGHESQLFIRLWSSMGYVDVQVPVVYTQEPVNVGYKTISVALTVPDYGGENMSFSFGMINETDPSEDYSIYTRGFFIYKITS